MRTNLAISNEIGKPTPVSPKNAKSKGVPPSDLDTPIEFTMDFNKHNFDCMAMEIIRLREKMKVLYKEVIHYQSLYIGELEAKRQSPSKAVMKVLKGGQQ